MKNKSFEMRLIFESEKEAIEFVECLIHQGGGLYFGFEVIQDKSDDWTKETPRVLALESFD